MIWFVSIGLTLGVGAIAFSRWDDRRLLKSLLNIPELPGSIQVEKCKSCAISDVISVCRFTLAPEDADKIVHGYPYREDASLTKYAMIVCGDVGTSFVPTTAFEFIPPEFKYGGWIRLFLSADRSQGLVEYYEE
jgi:hypothetical protein